MTFCQSCPCMGLKDFIKKEPGLNPPFRSGEVIAAISILRTSFLREYSVIMAIFRPPF